MKTRLTPEELARAHDGLCGISIGDGDCSCLVHWVEGHQKDLDARERQIAELKDEIKAKDGLIEVLEKLKGADELIAKANVLLKKHEPHYNGDRCFCAGTWHCKWCGKESCDGRSCRA